MRSSSAFAGTAETVPLASADASYEIDLIKKNASALRKAVADFVEHGPGRVNGGQRRGGVADGARVATCTRPRVLRHFPKMALSEPSEWSYDNA